MAHNTDPRIHTSTQNCGKPDFQMAIKSSAGIATSPSTS